MLQEHKMIIYTLDGNGEQLQVARVMLNQAEAKNVEVSAILESRKARGTCLGKHVFEVVTARDYLQDLVQ